MYHSQTPLYIADCFTIEVVRFKKIQGFHKMTTWIFQNNYSCIFLKLLQIANKMVLIICIV